MIPVARGERLQWDAAPPHVRSAVEAFLGDRVVDAVTQAHGFSAAVAARLRTSSGGRAFVKAVPPDANPDTPGIYRQEIEAAASLPAGLSIPRLLWSLDEGTDGWVVLLYEDLDGSQPQLPWSRDELERAVAAIDELAVALTPSPIRGLQQGERIARRWRRWQQWLEAPPAALEPWVGANLQLLADLESDVADLTHGDTLVHLDIRSDNLLMSAERCWVVDWAWPLPGAQWMDIVLFASSVEAEGGPAAEAVLKMSAIGRMAPAEGVRALVATFAGMLTVGATAPPPPGLPGLREFQAAHGRIALAWLRRLVDARPF